MQRNFFLLHASENSHYVRMEILSFSDATFLFLQGANVIILKMFLTKDLVQNWHFKS
jgi:hypothetical protein